MTYNPYGNTGSEQSPHVMSAGWRRGFAGRLVAIGALLMTGIGTGAVVGSVQAAQLSPDVSPLETTLASVGSSNPVEVAELIVEDPGAASGGEPVTGAEGAAKPAVTKRAAKPAPVTGSGAAVYVPVMGQDPAAQQAVDCARLDDKKIFWLLDLVAKAKASNPDQAAVADHVDGQLRSVLGQNICAEEAQIYVGAMCADPGVRNFMHLMTKELPFFVRPLVGDPCTQDLVAAADRWLP